MALSPDPMPYRQRPSPISFNVAIALAATAGCRVIGFVTVGPTRTRDVWLRIMAAVTYTSRNTDCESATPTRSNPAASAACAFATAPATLRGISMMPNFMGTAPVVYRPAAAPICRQQPPQTRHCRGFRAVSPVAGFCGNRNTPAGVRQRRSSGVSKRDGFGNARARRHVTPFSPLPNPFDRLRATRDRGLARFPRTPQRLPDTLSLTLSSRLGRRYRRAPPHPFQFNALSQGLDRLNTWPEETS